MNLYAVEILGKDVEFDEDDWRIEGYGYVSPAVIDLPDITCEENITFTEFPCQVKPVDWLLSEEDMLRYRIAEAK